MSWWKRPSVIIGLSTQVASISWAFHSEDWKLATIFAGQLFVGVFYAASYYEDKIYRMSRNTTAHADKTPTPEGGETALQEGDSP